LWRERKLTSGIGLYFSIKKDGLWFDSRQAKIKAVGHSPDSLEIEREWYFFDISHKERFCFKNGILNGSVHLKSLYPVRNCMLFHLGCMLIKEYSFYEIEGMAKGRCTEHFSPYYSYSPYVYFNVPASTSLILHSQSLPKLKIRSLSGEYSYVLENGDSLYESRVAKIERLLPDGIFKEAYCEFSIELI
jgi:hypothetical protein